MSKNRLSNNIYLLTNRFFKKKSIFQNRDIFRLKYSTNKNITPTIAAVLNTKDDENSFPTTQSSSKTNLFTFRSHTCGELNLNHIGENVTLLGWLEFVRMNKFIILRDSYGSTQCVITKDNTTLLNLLKKISHESIIQIKGLVTERPPHMVNKKLSTGEIEVQVNEMDMLNPAKINLPFNIRNFNKPKEALRLQHRYMDLRFPEMQRNMRVRSKILMEMRRFLIDECDFVEVETPTLFRKTPGGAQEFIVPTQLPGHCYSLVQSPQQFKQMLMVGGIDRYFQIARCYRDEGTRPDRQPEFTQLDIEMSFVNQSGIISLVETLLSQVLAEYNVTSPFRRMTYKEAMETYGTDKPDVRFDFKIQNFNNLIEKYPNSNLNDDFGIHGIFFDLLKKLPNSLRDSIITLKDKYPMTELLFTTQPLQDREWAKNINLKISENIVDGIYSKLNLSSNGAAFIAFGPKIDSLNLLGNIRILIMNHLEENNYPVKRESGYHFLWIVDFPLFEKGPTPGTYQSVHHPFSQPHPEDMHLLNSEPLKVRGLAYDLVLNGTEVGGGSIRIHNAKLQKNVLNDILKIDSSHLQHMLNALDSGCPPHGGIALGLDRLLATLLETNSIRDTIAFPKSFDGKDLLSGAPTEITAEDRVLYHIKEKDGNRR